VAPFDVVTVRGSLAEGLSCAAVIRLWRARCWKWWSWKHHL